MLPVDNSVTGLTAGVDYITAVARDKGLHEAMWSEARKLLDDEVFAGNRIVERGWRGMTGFQAGQITVMEKRGSYVMVQLRSELAAAQWRRMMKVSDHVTRLDLQVTVELAHQEIDLGDIVYNHVKNIQADLHSSVEYSIIANTKGGTTVYTGSRQSSRFGRLYDKGAQMGKPAGKIWRYEMELKKPVADKAAGNLLNIEQPEAVVIAATVHRWFEQRGMMPVFKATDSYITMEIPKVPTDDDRTLKWMREQVSAPFRRLVDKGYASTLTEILGVEIGEFVWIQVPMDLTDSRKDDE